MAVPRPLHVLRCLLLSCLLQQVTSSSTSCARRWQWLRTPRCPNDTGLGTRPVSLSNEAQCAFLCTSRQPLCKAAHFNGSTCSIAASFAELSLWSVDDQCRSLMLAPEILQLLVFFDFRESLQNVLGSASVTVQPLNLTRDDSGLHFAGRMTSLLKLTIPEGLSAFTDRGGERAVSFFMYIRRPYKAKSVLGKIGSESSETAACNFYEQDGKLIFTYNNLGKTFTSTDAFMKTDADPNGFFLGVAASNVTGAFAYLNNQVYGFAAAGASGPAPDSVIRVGMSTSDDVSCLNGTLVCFGIAAMKLSAEQFSRLALLCS